jgi:uncharacterized repeat protein (TIGR02543 family)
LNGGENHADNPETYTIEEGVILKDPSKKGYDFTSWAEGTSIAVGSTGDTTFTAQWSAHEYNIDYRLNGGENHADNPETYTIEEGVILRDPSKEGCTFTGWAGGNSIAIGSTGDTTFTAQWQCTEAKIDVVIDDIEIPVDSILSEENGNVLEYVVRDCEQSSISIALTEADASITVDGKTSTEVEIDLTDKDNILTTINIGEDQTYKLNISAPLKNEELYYKRWDDVIAINHNFETNGGYDISNVKWYKPDGTPAGEGEFIVVSSTENIDDYYSEVKTVTPEGIETVHKVCTPMPQQQSITAKVIAYPNPVPYGEKITLQLPESYVGSTLKIYDMKGALVKSEQSLPTKVNNIDISEFASGIYLLHITDKNGNVEVVKVINN